MTSANAGPSEMDTRSATAAEFRALVSAIESSPIRVPDLAAAALGDVLTGVITGEGPTAQGRMKFSRSLDATDTKWCERILIGAGGPHGAPVTRAEADRLFEIDAAATERNDGGKFDDLMVKAVAHHVIAATGRPVPPRDVALDPATPVASWASRFADIDGEVLRWIASHVKGKKRLGGPLMTIVTLLIGASTSPVTGSFAGVFDLLA